MTRVTPRGAILFLLASTFLYWALALVVPGPDLRALFSALSFGVYTMIAFTWFGPMVAELRGRPATPEAGEWAVVLAIFLFSALNSLRTLYTMIAVYLDRPTWLVDGPIAGFFPYEFMVSGALLLLAPGMVNHGETNRRSMLYVGAAAVLGAALLGYAVGRYEIPF